MASRSETADPRPRVIERDGGAVLVGVRCTVCGLAVAGARPRCPDCHGTVESAEFGPHGVVWSATVVRVPVPGREPPYALAYVDLTDGPRVLAHLDVGQPPDIGTRLRLTTGANAPDVHAEVV